MINLIPPEAKRRVVKEYWLRAAAVWMFLVSFAFVLLLSLQIPNYILVYSLESALANQFNSAQAEQSVREEAEAEVTQTNEIVGLLEADEENVNQFSTFIYELDVLSGEGVSITQFNFNRVEGELNNIGLIGEAADRVSLSGFRDALEADERFSNVELPISNLAKDSDITFSMNIGLVQEN